jgi:hypothetical protein
VIGGDKQSLRTSSRARNTCAIRCFANWDSQCSRAYGKFIYRGLADEFGRPVVMDSQPFSGRHLTIAWLKPEPRANPKLRPQQIVERRAPRRSIAGIVVILLDPDLIHKVSVIASVFGIPVMWMHRTKKTERQHGASKQLIRLFR